MRASRCVHGHTGNGCREVGAVVEIEPSQVVLIGLALAAVLADDHAGNGLEHFTDPHDRPCFELRRRDRRAQPPLGGHIAEPGYMENLSRVLAKLSHWFTTVRSKAIIQESLHAGDYLPSGHPVKGASLRSASLRDFALDRGPTCGKAFRLGSDSFKKTLVFMNWLTTHHS